ncbi:MAG: hypothetical protein ACXWUX_08270 [Allosphingosinicella sp.]
MIVLPSPVALTYAAAPQAKLDAAAATTETAETEATTATAETEEAREAREQQEAQEAREAARTEALARLPLSDVVAEALVPGTDGARLVARWVAASGDNGELPFMVIDKVAAAVFVFDPQGEFLGETAALLGLASGDEATPGSDSASLSEMGPEERTTPAGRFAARYGPAIGGQSVLWVDYTTSVALHPVVTGTRRERRLQRLRSATPEDNRITYGCINVPVAFHRDVIRPLFRQAGGIVYILPETKTLEEVFPSVRVRTSRRR